jgi:hypothetical protein
MPVPETERQKRWSFAAEARGELPAGTAEKWAHETKVWKARHCKCKGGACHCKGRGLRRCCLIGGGKTY